LTILTCYATSIVVIYLTLPANVRLFTFDTNGGNLLSMRLAVTWYFFDRWKVNSYKTTLHNLN